MTISPEVAKIARRVASEAFDELKILHSAPASEWSQQSSSEGIVVHLHKSIDENCKENVLRASITLMGTDLKTVKALVSPLLPYRLTWDKLLESLELLEQIEPNLYICHTVTAPVKPISARDSIDVVTMLEEEDRVIFATKGFPTEQMPFGPAEQKSTVRTQMNLGGYVISRNANGSIEFEVYFQCDLKVSSISLIKKAVDMLKPRLMVDKLRSLRKAVTEVAVDSAHM